MVGGTWSDGIALRHYGSTARTWGRWGFRPNPVPSDETNILAGCARSPSKCSSPHAPGVVREAQVAADDVLEQALRRLLGRLRLRDHHVAQHRADGKEALGRGADVVEAHLRMAMGTMPENCVACMALCRIALGRGADVV
jgi:hypothetical protein